MKEIETTLKGWSNYFRHSRWKQKEYAGRYKNLELLGLKLPSPPPQNTYNAIMPYEEAHR